MKNASPFKLSFEFFPPKTPEGISALQQTAQDLARVSPDFFSVTFGAGGSTRTGTLEAVTKLQQTNISIAPHLACIGLTRADLTSLLQTYQSLGVKRIVALRGDMPSGMGQNCELKFADELVTLIRETTHDLFNIEVAAYPEVHPQAKNALDDLHYFKKKVDAGANSAITQYFFNPDSYFYFVDQCIKQGISIPIIPGIMPITHFAKLARFSAMCGAEIPRWIEKRLASYADDQESIQAFGLEVVYNLCERLINGGVSGLHFYTLNHADTSLKLVDMLSLNHSRVSARQKITAR